MEALKTFAAFAAVGTISLPLALLLHWLSLRALLFLVAVHTRPLGFRPGVTRMATRRALTSAA